MSVGVIVPVYGTGRYLSEALDGILSQQPPPQEVIVVDDASPAPLALAPAHRECRLVRRERRGGPGAARNTALSMLATDLIACADADDVWNDGKLAVQMRRLEQHPDVGLCFGSAVIVGADGELSGERWRSLTPGPLAPEQFAPTLFEHNPIPTSSVVMRRELAEQAGGFFGPPPCEDWALWLRLLERGVCFLFEPQAKIAYRRHRDAATADISRLALAAIEVHDTFGGLVDEDTRRGVRSSDLVALARGRVREQRYREAHQLLAQAADLTPLNLRLRLLRAALAVPLLRGVLGRRDPY